MPALTVRAPRPAPPPANLIAQARAAIKDAKCCRGEVACPSCNGTLAFHRNDLGKLWARCLTAGCVAFME